MVISDRHKRKTPAIMLCGWVLVISRTGCSKCSRRIQPHQLYLQQTNVTLPSSTIYAHQPVPHGIVARVLHVFLVLWTFAPLASSGALLKTTKEYGYARHHGHKICIASLLCRLRLKQGCYWLEKYACNDFWISDKLQGVAKK